MSEYREASGGARIRLSDGARIEPDTANMDWVEYLRWEGAGGVTGPMAPLDINAPIYAQLEEVDRKSIRPAREGDTVRLAALEAQAQALRSQLVR